MICFITMLTLTVSCDCNIINYHFLSWYKVKTNEKRIYGIKINYRLLNDFLSNIGEIRRAKKRGDVSVEFEKHIMLAVTQVNGCRMCSYFHTKEALRLGMPEQEIQSLLSGDLSYVPEEEAVALSFAQHYAEKTGQYDDKAWRRVVDTYGEQRSLSILAYIRAIMAGNAQGNIIGALKSRFRGQPEPNSKFIKEIGVLFCDIFLIPFILVKGLLFMPFKSRKQK